MNTSTTNPELTEKIHELVEINVDSVQGFEQAAKLTRNPDLQRLFGEIADRRRENAASLRRFTQGDAPETSGTLKGKVHRWWLELRAKIQDGDDHPILAEAERGEDSIKSCYEQTLAECRGTAVSDVLRSQLARVRQDHDRIRDLRDASKQATA